MPLKIIFSIYLYLHKLLKNCVIIIVFLIFYGFVVDKAESSHKQFRYCNLDRAEECFRRLFYEMPFCSVGMDRADLIMRCQHFNHSIMCPPTVIGQAARNAFRQRINDCKFSLYSRNSDHLKIRKRKFLNNNNLMDLIRHGPSELQIISLFGYLQTQCRRRRSSSEPNSYSRRNSQDGGNFHGASSLALSNCSDSDYNDIILSCEEEIKIEQPTRQRSVLERHQLLRSKLDASSRLLQFPETKPEDECLMVRSELSDIFLIHQKYCFQTDITRCMCERFNFERACGIQCSNLEANGLPLNRELYWKDFRGRLTGSSGTPTYNISPAKIALITYFAFLLQNFIFNANIHKVHSGM